MISTEKYTNLTLRNGRWYEGDIRTSEILMLIRQHHIITVIF